jgi:hypothetical protein
MNENKENQKSINGYKLQSIIGKGGKIKNNLKKSPRISIQSHKKNKQPRICNKKIFL